jgi:hypothetical protein
VAENQLRLSTELDPSEVPAFLELERQSSAPYNRFVYGSEELTERVQRVLFDAGSGEFVPPHGRAVRLGERLVGMVAALSAAELRRARLAASLTLTRAGLIRDRGLRQRLKLASSTLLQPHAGDYYLSRITVASSYRGRERSGEPLSLQVLELVRREGVEAGASRLVADVAGDQPGLLAFYEKWGLRRLDGAEVPDLPTGRLLNYAHLAMDLRPAS